jgi:hypothetical protein
VADLSPGLAGSLELHTDDEVEVTIGVSRSDFLTNAAASAFIGTTGSAEPRIFTTSEWGAVPARVAYFPERLATGIVVHNTEGPNREPMPADAEFPAASQVAQKYSD